MVKSSLVGGARNNAFVQSVMDLVAAAIDAAATVRVEDFAQTIKVDGANYGKPFETGKRTIVIRLDGGDPEIEFEYLGGGGCCGE